MTFDSIIINQLKSAYRKYKTHLYYDNHSAIQREDLAAFESKNFLNIKNETKTFFDKENIDDTFKKLANNLINDELEYLLDEIEVIAFPKKMEDNESKIISNLMKHQKKLNKSIIL